MNLVQLAGAVFKRAEELGVPHMCVGAIAAGLYGIPRATKDIDLLVSMDVLGRSIWLPTAEMWWYKNFAGAGRRIWRTPATSSQCRIPKRST